LRSLKAQIACWRCAEADALEYVDVFVADALDSAKTGIETSFHCCHTSTNVALGIRRIVAGSNATELESATLPES
jgi:hypothetical protein